MELTQTRKQEKIIRSLTKLGYRESSTLSSGEIVLLKRVRFGHLSLELSSDGEQLNGKPSSEVVRHIRSGQ
jgi:hypothetical protein